jgi:hypothetical protein
MFTSWVFNPINDNTKTSALDGADSENRPSESVTVPFVVPFTTTFTPGNDDPSSDDVTFPVIVRSCAHAMLLISNKSGTNLISKFFLILVGLGCLLRNIPLRGVNVRVENNITIILKVKLLIFFQSIAEIEYATVKNKKNRQKAVLFND